MISIFDDTPEEKEQWIVDMLHRGYGWKQIMKECHVSPNTISSVKKKVSGSTENDTRKSASQISKETQALKLFKEGWKPLDVAIELDLDTDYVIPIQKKFWQLNGMHGFNQAYESVKGNIAPFLHLFDLLNSLGLTPEQVQEQVRYGYELPQLQSIHAKMNNQIQDLVYKQLDLDSQLESMKKEVQQYQNSIQFYDFECSQKRNEIVRLGSTISRKKRVIQRLDNNEGYKRVKEASKKETELLLQNNHQLLTDAISVTLETVRRFPAIKQLIFDLLTSDSTALYQQLWMECHKSQLIQLSEHIQSELIQQITRKTMSIIRTNTF